MRVNLRHPQNSQNIKNVKWGVSWLYFFFGGWAMLFQARWILFFGELILLVLTGLWSKLSILLALYHIVLWFCGNKIYAKYLLRHGWIPVSEDDAKILEQPVI